MRLKLERDFCGKDCTIGDLYVDDVWMCHTLEDTVREKPGVPVKGWKISGSSAIPIGSYNVVITYSERFKKDLPLLEAVEGFVGIRIHPGNTAVDTEGCILVGRTKTDKSVGESRAAFREVFGKIQEALDAGDTVTMEIT